MVRLFEGSGSSEIQLLGQSIPTLKWEQLKNVAVRLLERRGNFEAADLLSKYPFVVYEGTNGFGDEFHVLYMQALMATYVELAETAEDPRLRRQWSTVAEAVAEVITKHIRFVAVDLETTEELVY